jgi:hypothetical protein
MFDHGESLLVSPQGLAVPTLVPSRHVEAGDWVGITYGGEWPDEPAKLPPLADRPLRRNEKRIRLPGMMTSDLAFLLGAYFSEGHTSRMNWTVTITNSVEDVLERVRQAWHDVFGIRTRLARPADRCMHVTAASKRVVEFMTQLEIGSRASHKAVPACIMQGTREHAITFLQGAALDAYTTTVTASKWAICLESAVGIHGLQELLTRLAVPNAQIAKFNRQMNKTYFELYAPGRAGQELCRMVRFLEPDKAARADAYVAATIGRGGDDVIPGVSGRELYDLVPKGQSGRKGNGSGRQALRYLCDARTARVCRSSVKRAREAGATLPDWLDELVDSPIRFSPVVACGAQSR